MEPKREKDVLSLLFSEDAVELINHAETLMKLGDEDSVDAATEILNNILLEYTYESFSVTGNGYLRNANSSKAMTDLEWRDEVATLMTCEVVDIKNADDGNLKKKVCLVFSPNTTVDEAFDYEIVFPRDEIIRLMAVGGARTFTTKRQICATQSI
jgi:hypothetical protein